MVAIYSTFLQRGYDQLVHDIALQNLDVTFGIDRAGLVGEDGPTHAGAYDYAYMRTIPNMVIMAPSDENECRQMLTTAFEHKGPAAVRYPRGTGPGAVIEKALSPLPLGRGVKKRDGKRVAILSFGALLPAVMKAADALDASVADMRFVKPLDVALVQELAATHELLVTVEEHAVMGGAGSAVNECLAASGIVRGVLNLGIPDAFIEHASPAEMLAECGLDAAGIEAAIRARLGS